MGTLNGGRAARRPVHMVKPALGSVLSGMRARPRSTPLRGAEGGLARPLRRRQHGRPISNHKLHITPARCHRFQRFRLRSSAQEPALQQWLHSGNKRENALQSIA
ncbi:hypothetical protein GLA29479_1425 [Lysobacter antibioticus]|nr:hypothetical protein GLA29479_1425 [Lysobacter antibioticus]